MQLMLKTKAMHCLLAVMITALLIYFAWPVSAMTSKKGLQTNKDALQAETTATVASLPTLKVLTWTGTQSYLPRSGFPQDLEITYLKEFASQQKLQFENIKVDNFSDLIPMLLAGKGDVIAENLTVTVGRKKKVMFTTPFTQTNEYLLMGKKSKALHTGNDLNGRELVVQKGKSYQISALGLKKVYPKLTLRYIDHDISNEDIYDKLASGDYDLTIQDNNIIQAALDYRDDIKRSLQASSKQDIAWAVAPDNSTLLNQLNLFIQAQSLAVPPVAPVQSKSKTQWQKIIKNKTVRFVLRNNLSSYYIWRGELLGFHYELAKRFALDHKLRYEIIVAPDNVALIDYIIEDKADIALGFLTPTQQRRDKGISFSRPYHYASELLIAHQNFPEIATTADLGNAKVYLRPSSAYWQSALRLQKQDPQLQLVAVSEEQETESIIADVAHQKYQLTIADSHIVDIEMTFRSDIQSLMALGVPNGQSWAVKTGHSELLRQTNLFIKKYYKGLFYNVIYNRYFKNTPLLTQRYNDYEALKSNGVLSPYDDIVKKYAQQYGFDWRLLVAQMHQESRFDPKATSMVGAKGLFQIMPRTAQELGITNVHIPELGIKAGVRYMDWVRDRMIKNSVQDDQLIWFTLASYNAGAGHVRDAMSLAKQKGWRSDIWFDNVEQAMLLLAQNKYALKARYGYVRGEEPVTYIREIRRRYESYQNILKRE